MELPKAITIEKVRLKKIVITDCKHNSLRRNP